MKKMILKRDFIDHTDRMRNYSAGDDVSHISDEQKKFLIEGGHIEENVEDEDADKDTDDSDDESMSKSEKKSKTSTKGSK